MPSDRISMGDPPIAIESSGNSFRKAYDSKMILPLTHSGAHSPRMSVARTAVCPSQARSVARNGAPSFPVTTGKSPTRDSPPQSLAP